MTLELKVALDNYPNPFYIVRPIVIDGVSEDFEYIYANEAFCLFLGWNREELVGHSYVECFKMPGEQQWLDTFMQAAVGNRHEYVDHVSVVINRKMYTEVFHIEPDMCGCIIHDFQYVADEALAHENRELRHKANYDFLTDFYNRFYLKELSAEISRKENVGITFLDINNLKETNDNYGHAAGDRLIRRVADTLRSSYKDSLFFRMGGDEFLVITIGQDEEKFLDMSDRNRKLFEEQSLAALGYHFYEKIEDLQACIEECDALMYERKKYLKQ
jgi:diguanylate cyclase (GGDEF)-like protein